MCVYPLLHLYTDIQKTYIYITTHPWCLKQLFLLRKIKSRWLLDFSVRENSKRLEGWRGRARWCSWTCTGKLAMKKLTLRSYIWMFPAKDIFSDTILEKTATLLQSRAHGGQRVQGVKVLRAFTRPGFRREKLIAISGWPAPGNLEIPCKVVLTKLSSRSWLVMGVCGLNAIHFQWCKSKLENRASYYTREREAMGNNKNQATLISFEQLNIYRSLFLIICRPPSTSPHLVLKPLRQKQQNTVCGEMKKAIISCCLKNGLSTAYRCLLPSYVNGKLGDGGGKLTLFGNSPVFWTAILFPVTAACSHTFPMWPNYSLPNMDHKRNYGFCLKWGLGYT